MTGSYDNFAKSYADAQGESGDFYHKTQIDPFIYKIIGNPTGKKIYDIGCGNGHMAKTLAIKGAVVFASDISPNLIKIAKEKNGHKKIKYFVNEATDFSNFIKQKFDVIILNMVVNYIKDLDTLMKGVSNVLKNNGLLVISTNHPIRPAFPYSFWEKGEIYGHEKLFIKTTDYLKSINLKVKSGWDPKTELNLVNRPFGEYVNTMSKYGLLLKKVYEPKSVGFAKDFPTKLQKTNFIPTFIIIGAVKKT